MRIALTRPEGRGTELAARLRERGHEVALVPLTRIEDAEPFPDPAGFDGVLFTSVSAVERAPEGAAWAGVRVGAVGAFTAAALRERGLPVDVVGTGGGAELAAAWGPAEGQRLLLPQAERAHPALADGLRAAGAEVFPVAVYRTVALERVDRAALSAADVICFFAPSAVRAFEALGLETGASFWGYGPTTRAAMAKLSPLLDELPGPGSGPAP